MIEFLTKNFYGVNTRFIKKGTRKALGYTADSKSFSKKRALQISEDLIIKLDGLFSKRDLETLQYYKAKSSSSVNGWYNVYRLGTNEEVEELKNNIEELYSARY